MTENNQSKIAVITGTRAEYGLLQPVITAIQNHPALQLQLIVTGTHLLPELNTITAIEKQYTIDARIPMQQPDDTPSRAADIRALARGIAGFGSSFDQLNPQIVIVLGDRIEAFAAASAASIGGRLLAHIHGGDRAQGVADEAMRHAITKLAHIHFPATEQSASRIIKMGENEKFVFTVGSPAIDNLDEIQPATNQDLQSLNLNPDKPFAIILHHPSGLANQLERKTMQAILKAVENHPAIPQYLIMAPNRDPGRNAIIEALANKPYIENLPRKYWIALLKRAALLIGNSSAALIEAAAIGLPALNLGPRQSGRERAANIIDLETNFTDSTAVAENIKSALNLTPPFKHPYGPGNTGKKIATHLAQLTQSPPPIKKHNTY